MRYKYTLLEQGHPTKPYSLYWWLEMLQEATDQIVHTQHDYINGNSTTKYMKETVHHYMELVAFIKLRIINKYGDLNNG